MKKFDKKRCMDFTAFIMTEQNNDTKNPLIVFSDYNGIRLNREISTKLKSRVLCERIKKTAKTSSSSNQKTEGIVVGTVFAVILFIAAVLYVIPYTRVSFFLN